MSSFHDALIVDNLPLVRFVAKRYVRPGVELDDLYQQGCVGLLLAAQRYDPNRGRFAAFAVRCIRQSIWALQRGVVRVPRQAFKSPRTQRQALLALRVGALNADPVAAESRERPQIKLRGLDRREKIVIKLRFWKGWRLAAIGARFDISKQRVQQILDDALLKLRTSAICRRPPVQLRPPLPIPSRPPLPCLDCLYPIEQQIIRLRHYDKSLSAIAKRLRITPQLAGQIERRALSKLKGRP